MEHRFFGYRRSARRGLDDRGMTTAEYALGTLAACAFAALLMKILTGDKVSSLVAGLIERALTSFF
jgi:hypothetical protein